MLVSFSPVKVYDIEEEEREKRETYNLILANSTSSSNIPGSPFLLLFNFEIAASSANRRDSSFLRRDLYSDTVDCACSGYQYECEARVESMRGTCGHRVVWELGGRVEYEKG
jgi:hypothetical protein